MTMNSMFVNLVILHLSVPIKATAPYHTCVDNSLNYTSNSVYGSNLNTLLSSLPANINSSGFYSASLGQKPDRAKALVDVQLETCRSCVGEAAVDLVTSCLNRKQGFVWFELCMLRYSNESTFGIPPNKSLTIWMGDSVYVLDLEQFSLDLRMLVYELVPEAAYCGALRKVAAGNRSTSAVTNIYALEQCTPDLSVDDCIDCLKSLVEFLPRCCYTRDSATGLNVNCQLGYGTEVFYNETRS